MSNIKKTFYYYHAVSPLLIMSTLYHFKLHVFLSFLVIFCYTYPQCLSDFITPLYIYYYHAVSPLLIMSTLYHFKLHVFLSFLVIFCYTYPQCLSDFITPLYIYFFSLKACRYITAIYITQSGLFGKELYKHICFRSNPLHVHNIVFVIFTLY